MYVAPQMMMRGQRGGFYGGGMRGGRGGWPMRGGFKPY